MPCHRVTDHSRVPSAEEFRGLWDFQCYEWEILSRSRWVSHPTCPRNGHIIIFACWLLSVIDISAVHQYFWFSSPLGHTLHVSIPLKLPMAMWLALAKKMWVDLMCVSPEWKDLRPHAPLSIYCLLLTWKAMQTWCWDGCILGCCWMSLWSRALSLPILDSHGMSKLTSLMISCWNVYVFPHCSKT